MMGANLTGSIPIGPTIAKAIASQVHTSLANASTTAEKAVGSSKDWNSRWISSIHGISS